MSAPTRRSARKLAAIAKKRNAHDEALRRLLACEHALDVGGLLRINGATTLDALVPTGSVLDAVVRALKRETDCPPLLGVITTFAVLSAALCQAGSTFSYHDDLDSAIRLDLWWVMLAESGAGKTFVRDVVTKALGINLPSIPTPGSGVVFLDSLASVGGVGYWDKDEYGQTIKQISHDSTLTVLKDLLLQCYDHKKLTNNTRKHGLVEVENPVLTIYGSTPIASLSKCLSMEMLVDGFAARHLWASTNCPDLDVFRYNARRVRELIAQHPAVAGLRETLGEKRQFIITESAEAVLKSQFREVVSTLGNTLSRGFVRRITWTAGHYSVLYHLLTQKSPGQSVGVHAARWAWRMVMYHLHSTRHVLSLVDPGVTSKIERMSAWLNEQRKAGTMTNIERRFFQRFSRDISSVSEARQLLQICGLAK